jgi:hypothetical protein
VRIVVLEFGLGRLAAQDHPEADRLTHGAKLERADPSGGSGRRPAPAGLGQRAAPKRSGPGPPGALPACPPGSLPLGCDPWAPAAGSRPATRPRHRLGSPVPRQYPDARGWQTHGSQVRAIRVSAPRHTGRQPQVSTHSCSRAAVRLAPSESVPRGTRAISAPRAVGCVLVALGRLPTEPSRATSVPASGPRVPSRASLSVPGAATRPPATRAFAPRSGKQPPPLHNVRPGTAKRSGPGRPGALPACPPRGRLLGSGPRAPAAGSRPATRHRLGSPVPR